MFRVRLSSALPGTRSREVKPDVHARTRAQEPHSLWPKTAQTPRSRRADGQTVVRACSRNSSVSWRHRPLIHRTPRVNLPDMQISRGKNLPVGFHGMMFQL